MTTLPQKNEVPDGQTINKTVRRLQQRSGSNVIIDTIMRHIVPSDIENQPQTITVLQPRHPNSPRTGKYVRNDIDVENILITLMSIHNATPDDSVGTAETIRQWKQIEQSYNIKPPAGYDYPKEDQGTDPYEDDMSDGFNNIWPKELWILYRIHFDYPGSQLTLSNYRKGYKKYNQMTLEELEDEGY